MKREEPERIEEPTAQKAEWRNETTAKKFLPRFRCGNLQLGYGDRSHEDSKLLKVTRSSDRFRPLAFTSKERLLPPFSCSG